MNEKLVSYIKGLIVIAIIALPYAAFGIFSIKYFFDETPTPLWVAIMVLVALVWMPVVTFLLDKVLNLLSK